MSNYEQFKLSLEEYVENWENGDFSMEEKILDLEQNIKEELEYLHYGDNEAYKKLLAEIKNKKEEYDFYDEETELNMMFPNREDDEDFE